MNLEIHVQPLAGPRLVRDYLERAPALEPFFNGSPGDPESYRRKAAELARRFDASRRAAMAKAVRATSPAASRRLADIAAGNGFFVTTGQQPGLLSGPLYTIYKIFSAIRLARALEPIVERPVSALFWVASEDHDWDEARQTTLVNAAGQLTPLALAGPEDGTPRSMARRMLDADADRMLEDLAGLLPPTEFSASALALASRCYRKGSSVAGAFTELIAELFAPFDLLLVDAADPALKALSAGILSRELAHSEEHEALVAAQTDRLTVAGYHAQVPAIPGATNVFYEDPAGGRERLFRDPAGGLRLRHSGRRMGLAEAQELLVSEPTRFSPNVLLRPVVESSAFPTLAYVAGPGELSYYAQAGSLYWAHGIEMPVVYPRASLTLVERKVRKVLDKFGLAVADLEQPLHELSARIVREELPEPVRQAIRQVRESIERGYDSLSAAASAIDPTLAGPLGGARTASELQLADAEKKILQIFRKQREIGIEQLEKAAQNLYPGGVPQERVLNLFSYLVRYGPDLLPALESAIRVDLTGEIVAV